ncbi:transferase family protein [Dactylonectria macrodidyma]|uniref:Transferase family protein n=1 Tax=Dactylonectria macrodidyma TaxID=307937 RepID=A0A9P9FVI2_9HYPO|nr:transferase family protein [Dactylonectria macrodidyma]
MPSFEISVTQTERLLPRTTSTSEQATPLSILDATTANFALTNAIWLFERPSGIDKQSFNSLDHLRQSLRATLDIYPQWCGRLKAVRTIDGTVDDEAKHFPPHARRYGRVYVHYGTSHDQGVEFVTARSLATLDDLYSLSRTTNQPLWNRQTVPLKDFAPSTAIASALKPDMPNEGGLHLPLLAIQITELACGGFILAAKITHPLADISTLVRFVKDWAQISSSTISGSPETILSPVFDPARLDALAAGDINAGEPDTALIEHTNSLPLHRYDWWAASTNAPWPTNIPDVFQGEDLTPVGQAMPWSEWNVSAPVSNYLIHLSHDQVELLYKHANNDLSHKLSRHDAVVAHIWSCIVRARNLKEDTGPVHCDLVLGVRPAFQLGDAFVGSPVIMMNVEMPGMEVAATTGSRHDAESVLLWPIAQRVRDTIRRIGDPVHLAAHLHRLAYEKSPQRVWQAFLGRRHILVTSWARAGIYDVDFGLGSSIRYADGVVPDMDGNILIKEAPPSLDAASSSPQSWTGNGVDVSVHICAEDMQRLLQDPLLLPKLP